MGRLAGGSGNARSRKLATRGTALPSCDVAHILRVPICNRTHFPNCCLYRLCNKQHQFLALVILFWGWGTKKCLVRLGPPFW